MNTALLLLADARLPAGGHAHSGGLEAAVAAGRITDLADLRGFLDGRLATTGLVNAAFAAAATGRDAAELDDLLDARTPAAALRRASRAQGRALLRAGRAMWPRALGPTARPTPEPHPTARPTPEPHPTARPTPEPHPTARPTPEPLSTAPLGPASDAAGPPPRLRLHRPDPHHPIALGIVARAAGLTAAEAALAAAYGTITGPASAAIRLLSWDPYPVQTLLAELAPACDRVAEQAAGAARDGELPAHSAPLLDISAHDHATWEVRLFVS